MPHYKYAVWELMHKMVEDMNLKKEDRLKKDEVFKWFATFYPLIKQSTISAHLTRMSVNATSRPHYKAKPKQDDLLFKIDSKTYRLYDPGNDPTPIYELSEDSVKREKNPKVPRLEEKESIITFHIYDDQLRDRMDRVKFSPTDTIIREASVILEDRLKKLSQSEGAPFGKRLVNEILDPTEGLLVFSDHPNEQDGVRMLYMGAFQFIRNPAMHNLIEYSDNATRIFVQLIDSLLQILTELDPRHRGEATLEEVRSIFKIEETTSSQHNLFSVFMKSDRDWLSFDDLSTDLDLNRNQVANIIGSIGKRVNRTPGLENRGATSVVFDKKKESGETYYRMKPVLQMAIELEKII